MKYLNQVITVSLWEFRRFFKPKNEVLGIMIMLMISAIFYFVGKYAFSESGEKPELTVIQDMDSTLITRLSVDFTLTKIPAEQKPSVIKQISDSKKGILLTIENNAFALHAYKNARVLKKLRASLEEYHRTQKMKSIGVSPAEMAVILSPASVTETFVYTDNSKSRVLLAFVFAGLMIMAVFLSFAYQFTAITGEKQLKITEQIVSAIRPQVWMDGKIFGITLTGTLSMFNYSLLGIIGGVLYFQFTGVPASAILAYLYLPSILLYIPFAFTGILIWNALMAAVASVITDPNNSGKSSLMMLPLLFVLASFLVIRDPDSSISVFMSWFPLTSATSMPMRWAVTEVEYWQLGGSFIVLVATFYLLRKLAAKIFQVSIMISGKEPSWREIFKLLRVS